jgi:hypothetical protein
MKRVRPLDSDEPARPFFSLREIASEMDTTVCAVRAKLSKLRRDGKVGRRRPPMHGKPVDRCRVCDGKGTLPSKRIPSGEAKCIVCKGEGIITAERRAKLRQVVTIAVAKAGTMIDASGSRRQWQEMSRAIAERRAAEAANDGKAVH